MIATLPQTQERSTESLELTVVMPCLNEALNRGPLHRQGPAPPEWRK